LKQLLYTVLAYSHHFDANIVIILYSGKLLYVFLSLGDNNSPFFVKKPHFSASAAPLPKDIT